MRRAGTLKALRERCRAGGDRGSGAGAVLIFAVMFLGLAAFVIDGGLSISQRERATDIAEQAARYAAQDIDKEALYLTGEARILYQNCPQRVARFTKQVGLTPGDIAASSCLAGNAQEVEVQVRLTYRPVLTGLFYDRPIEVYGTAKAESETG